MKTTVPSIMDPKILVVKVMNQIAAFSIKEFMIDFVWVLVELIGKEKEGANVVLLKYEGVRFARTLCSVCRTG